MEHGAKDSWQEAADSGQLIRHTASESLGHYASLSFVVIGRS